MSIGFLVLFRGSKRVDAPATPGPESAIRAEAAEAAELTSRVTVNQKIRTRQLKLLDCGSNAWPNRASLRPNA